jgi:hypothetical protein
MTDIITRLFLVLVLAAAHAGCWLSTGRDFAMTADASLPDAADAPDDAAFDPGPDGDIPDLDAADPDAEPDIPPPPCLYGLMGVRLLAESGHATKAPDLVWTGSDVGVVVAEMDGDIGHPVVSMTRVAPDLASQTPLRVIGEESHGWGEAAWTGEALGLCWHTDPGWVGRTALRLLDRDGNALGGRVDLDFEGEACLDLVYGSNMFLAAWRHSVWVDEDYLIDSRIQLLDGDGTPAAEPVDLGRSEYPGYSPSSVFDGSRFIAAMAADDGIELTWVETSGEISRHESLDAPGAAFAALGERDGWIALFWTRGPRDERGLVFQVFDEALRPQSELLIAADGSGSGHPEIVPAADGWVLAWYQGPSDDPLAMVLHLDERGNVMEPRRAMVVGPNSEYGGPALLSVDNMLFAALSYPPDFMSGHEQVHLLRYECTPGQYDICAYQEAEIPVVCDDPVTIGWRYTGGDRCEKLVGCPGDCVGADCAWLARTEWDCLADRQHCYGWD